MLTVLLTSPRVAPGLLTYEAWDLLRSGATVSAPAGHPLVPVLASAGVAVEIAARAPSAGVWLAPPGSTAADFGDAVVVAGSADVPGAHFIDLVVTMDRLRADCLWDAKQTHQSLAPHLLEEPYEALEALESGDMKEFRDELGDVLLQVVFHARIAAGFDIDDVADQIVAKLVRRHPHVFGDVTVADAEEVKRNWDAIKKAERAAVGPGAAVAGAAEASVLDGVPFGQPALALAAQLQRRAARAGVPESLTELPGPGHDATRADDATRASVVTGSSVVAGRGALVEGDGGFGSPDADGAARIGGELFRLVARARAAGVDPELELRAAARRYRDLVRGWERTQNQMSP